MTVRFLGMVETTLSGCKCSGRKETKTFSRHKDFYLPSGILKTFYAGREVEVSDEDGEFLLEYKEFERV